MERLGWVGGALVLLGTAVAGCDEAAGPRGVDEVRDDRDGCGAGPCEGLEDFRLAPWSLTDDWVGSGDAALGADGTPDAVFEVTIEGAVSSLSLVPVLPNGDLYYYWHYDTVVGDDPIADGLDTYWDTGADTWVLGVWHRQMAQIANAPDGSLELGDGFHELVLFANDSEIHGRGLSWRLVLERPDGTTEVSPIVTDTSKVALHDLNMAAPMGQADRVAPGDLGVGADGACDLAFDLQLTGRVRQLALVSVDEDGNPNGSLQWDTIVGEDPVPSEVSPVFPFGAWTWALGVFTSYDDTFGLNPDGVLMEDRNLWTRTVRLFGAGDVSFTEGIFRAAAVLHDGRVVFSPSLRLTQMQPFGDCGSAPACCAPSGAPGCEDAALEACVCAADPYCCDVAWDGLCVQEVGDLCGGAC